MWLRVCIQHRVEEPRRSLDLTGGLDQMLVHDGLATLQRAAGSHNNSAHLQQERLEHRWSCDRGGGGRFCGCVVNMAL